MYRAGIIGCGNIARMHTEALKKIQGVQICAFADCDLDRAIRYREQARIPGAACYTSLAEMLEKEKPDVVHICTPHYLHAPMTIQVLQAGAHVFMEKPPAISVKEFEALKAAKRKSEKQVGICFQNRYNETTEKIHMILREKTLGLPVGARAFLTWDRDRDYYVKSGWRGQQEKEGGGVLINQAIHTLDLLVYLLGKPQMVEASCCNHHLKDVIQEEDTLEAYIQFDSSAACFYATTAYAEDAPVLLEILCREGRIRMEGNRLDIFYKKGNKEEYDFESAPNGIGKKYWGNSHGVCIQDFYNSLTEKKTYRNDLESTEATFKLAMGIYDSARNDHAVTLEKE